MELAQLIAPTGAWGKIWLAAHWDRKLKKEDYEGVDVRHIISELLASRALMSLRVTGHLLLGACKVYAKKFQLLDDEAVEVRTRLWLAFSTFGAQPGSRTGAPATTRAGGFADFSNANEDLGATDAVMEPPPLDLAVGAMFEQAAVRNGKRHTARLEDITLRQPAVRARRIRLAKELDDFGAMTGAELDIAMRELREKCVFPLETFASASFEETMPLVAVNTPDLAKGLFDFPAPLVSGLATHPAPLDDVEFGLEDPALAMDIPAGASLVPAEPMPEEVMILRFYGLSLATVNKTAFIRDLIAQFIRYSVSESALAQVRTKLTDGSGSVVAEVSGSPSAVAELKRKVIFGDVYVMGAVANVEDYLDPEEAADAIAERVREERGVAAPLVGVDGANVKRRRKAYFIYDNNAEISKETYQQYVNDRSSITRKNLVDYTIVLPHYSPLLPNFTTTFTDLCPALAACLLNGTEVAEKRRRLLADIDLPEHSGDGALDGPSGLGFPSMSPPAPSASPFDIGPGVAAPASGVLSPVSPVFSPIAPDQSGLRSPSMIAPGTPSGVPFDGLRSPLVTEVELLEYGPASMAAVITGNMDEEDQSANVEARLGYSGRTEKMHRYLAKEFAAASTKSLSYERMCRTSATGRRELIAGCFFELLVLKTNGVIGLKQEGPLEDIKISKATLWSRS